jgi:hypothetical protein
MRNTPFILLFYLAILSFGPTRSHAQWLQADLTGAGYVYSFAVGRPNLFAGTRDGGVFISTDRGMSWKYTGLRNIEVRALALSGSNLFAGTYDAGVFLSENNVTIWAKVNRGLTNKDILSFAILGGNLFAGTSGGVFLSTNSGKSWVEANTGLTSSVILSFAVSGGNVFAGTGDGVFLSTNGGASWTMVNSGLASTKAKIVNALLVSGMNLFAGTNDGVYLSTNDGTSWTQVNTGLKEHLVNALSCSDGNVFAGTFGGGVFLSTNEGSSWVPVNAGMKDIYVHSLVVTGTDLFAGTTDRVWRRSLSEMVPALAEEPRIFPVTVLNWSFSEYVGLLRDHSWKLNSKATELIKKMLPATTVHTWMKASDLTFVEVVTVKELGFPDGATFKQICQEAQERGLHRCTVEQGIHSCLSLTALNEMDQPNLLGKVDICDVFIAMYALQLSDNGDHILCFSRGYDGQREVSTVANPDNVFFMGSKAFAFETKK